MAHIEWFDDHVRIESMLFDGAASVTGDRVPVLLDRPGHGLELRCPRRRRTGCAEAAEERKGAMDATTAVPLWHTSAIARLVWGGTLTAVPHRVLRRLGRPTGLAVATLRVLGVRHLVQAALTVRRPTPEVLTVGAATDGLHALTAVALAGLDRRQRRLALFDAAIAGGWMLLDLGAARHPRQWTGGRSRLRGLGRIRSGRGSRR